MCYSCDAFYNFMPINKSYGTYKNVQNVTSLVANKKQETPVRSYYLLFHCLTSCS